MANSQAGLLCILCGEEAPQLLQLDDCVTVECSSCEGDYTLVDVETQVWHLSRLIRIVRAAKAASEGE
jgi:hypothetical protein